MTEPAPTSVEPTSDWGRGDWSQLYSGRQFFPMSPRPEDVDAVDIGHALGMLCRYNGHVSHFYSVAEHSVHVSRALEAAGEDCHTQLAGLLHDAAEAYVGDMVRPLKLQMPAYVAAEDRVLGVIFEHFLMPPEFAVAMPVAVREADNRILLDERAALLTEPPVPWQQEGLEPLGVVIRCWGPEEASAHWQLRLAELLPVCHDERMGR